MVICTVPCQHMIMPRTFLVKRREPQGLVAERRDAAESSSTTTGNHVTFQGVRKNNIDCIVHPKKRSRKEINNDVIKRHLKISKATTFMHSSGKDEKKGGKYSQINVKEGKAEVITLQGSPDDLTNSGVLQIRNKVDPTTSARLELKEEVSLCSNARSTVHPSLRLTKFGRATTASKLRRPEFSNCCQPSKEVPSQPLNSASETNCACQHCKILYPNFMILPKCFCCDCLADSLVCREDEPNTRSSHSGAKYPDRNVYRAMTERKTENFCTLPCCNPRRPVYESFQRAIGAVSHVEDVRERRSSRNVVKTEQADRVAENTDLDSRHVTFCHLCKECCGCDLPRKDVICCQPEHPPIDRPPNSDLNRKESRKECFCAQCKSSVERFIREEIDERGEKATEDSLLHPVNGTSTDICNVNDFSLRDGYHIRGQSNGSLIAEQLGTCDCDKCVETQSDEVFDDNVHSEDQSSPEPSAKQDIFLVDRKRKSEGEISIGIGEEPKGRARGRKAKITSKIPKPAKFSEEITDDYKKTMTSLTKSRLLANLLERRRVAELNHAFDRLRGIVPCYGNEDRTLSKIKTLRYAITYIAHLGMISEKLGQDGLYNVKTEFPKLYERDPLLQKCKEHLESLAAI